MKRKMSMNKVFEGFNRVLEVYKVEGTVPMRDEEGEIEDYVDGLALILSDNMKFPHDAAARVPYKFIVNRYFELDLAEKPILPVKFRQDENLRKALEFLRIGEAKNEWADYLLNSDTEVGFLCGNFEEEWQKSRKLKGSLMLDDPIYASHVLVKIRGEYDLNFAAFYEAKNYALVRDETGSWNTYLLLDLENKTVLREDEPIGEIWYGNAECRMKAVWERLIEALEGHQTLIQNEKRDMNRARRRQKKEERKRLEQLGRQKMV